MPYDESNKMNIDLCSPKHAMDPYPTYKYLRDHAPVCRVKPNDLWAISRYDDVRYAFKHHEFFSSSGYQAIHQVDWLDESCWMDLFILTQDPPLHSLHHSVINRAFVKRAINALVPYMRQQIKALIKWARQQPNVEFIQHIAYPYIAGVILKIVGAGDQLQVSDLYHWMTCLEKIGPVRPDDATVKEIEAAITRQNNCFDEIIADRRRNPRQDLATAIVNAVMRNGQRLDDRQLRGALHLIVGAGFHAGTIAFSKAVLFLARHRDLHRTLAKSPALIPAFTEEILRFDGPVHGLARRTCQPVTLSDVNIPTGEVVLLLPASANRDPRHFSAPDTFDMSRKNAHEHLAFGHGVHTCIGAALARLEMNIALEEILTSCSGIECPPDDQLDWMISMTDHSFRALPVRFY